MNAIGLLLLPLILVFVVLIPILIGVYVYRDAKARRMDAVLWTIIAVIAPGLIGFIVYLIVRNGNPGFSCPQCGAEVTEQYLACPQCGAGLKRRCTACGAAAEANWQVCPYCGAPLPPAPDPPAVRPKKKKDRALLTVILCAIVLPVLLCVLFLTFALLNYGGMRMNHAVSTSFTYAQEVDRREAAGSAAMWLENCESREAGVYVLMNTEEKDGQITTSYLVYRKGLTAETGGNWEEGGDPSAPCITLSYTDDKSGNPPGSDYDLQWAAYTGEAMAELEIRIDGEPVAVVPKQSESPILLVAAE